MEYRELLRRAHSDGIKTPDFPRLRRWKKSASRLIWRLKYVEDQKKREKMADKAIDLLFAIAYIGGV